MNDFFGQTLTTLAIIALVCVTVAVIGLTLLVRRIRRLHIPPDADFFSTMRMIPLVLVVMLDLLDFGLDIFATPIAWLFLDRMGLRSLRNKAVVEAIIPFSGPIPTFTLAWFAARMLNLGASEMRVVEQYTRVPRPRIIDVDDQGRTRPN